MIKALTKRTAFTKAELALIAQRREEWLAVGRSTAPADRTTAEAVLTKMYGVLKLPRPLFIWGRSPVESLYFGVMVKALIDNGSLKIATGQLRDQLRGQLSGQLGDQLWGQLGGQLRGQLWEQLGGQLGEQLRDQLRDQLGDQLRDQLWGQLRDQLGDQLRGQLSGQLGGQLSGQLGEQLGGQLRGQLWEQLGGQLGEQLRDQLRDQLGDQLGDQLRDQLWGQQSQTWHWGAHDSAWVAFYEVGKELGIHYTDQLAERLDWHQDLCRSALWVQSFSGICFVSERPTHQTLDERGQLHYEAGPAMRFGDDYRLYAWHGVRVPAWVIETPADQLTVAQVTGEANQEVRRVLLERMGWGRYLRESGAVARQEDVYGKLYSIPVDDQRTLGIVEVANGTPEPLAGDYTEDAGYVHKADGRWYKKYFLRVPSAMTTAHQAVAWTYFETPESYAPLSRT